MAVFNINSIIIPIIMMIEIYILEFLFSLKAERKKNFWLSYIGYGLLSIYLVVFTIILYNVLTKNDFEYGKTTTDSIESLFNFFLYLSVFVLVTVVYILSYKQSISQSLCCCSVAYCIQHIVKSSSHLFSFIPSIDNNLIIIINILFFILSCILTFFLFIKKGLNTFNSTQKKKSKIFISLFVILICIGMSRITNDNAGKNLLSFVADDIYAMLCCFLVLYIQFGIAENEDLHYKVDCMQEVLHQEKKQYQLSKENIDLINIKCHDLKYQISALRNNYSEKNLASIEHAVMIYDSTIKTGNDVLDVILTEKKLQCENKNIDMTCSVNGELITFMENIDVYTLFGNLLSNAIESTCKVKEIENRCMSITIQKIQEMIILHMENCFEGTINFKDGLPITTKDTAYHGYGMKSIDRVVKKYFGELSIITKDNNFILDIIFPNINEISKRKKENIDINN